MIQQKAEFQSVNGEDSFEIPCGYEIHHCCPLKVVGDSYKFNI